jgi:hypothetical protein
MSRITREQLEVWGDNGTLIFNPKTYDLILHLRTGDHTNPITKVSPSSLTTIDVYNLFLPHANDYGNIGFEFVRKDGEGRAYMKFEDVTQVRLSSYTDYQDDKTLDEKRIGL